MVVSLFLVTQGARSCTESKDREGGWRREEKVCNSHLGKGKRELVRTEVAFPAVLGGNWKSVVTNLKWHRSA